MSIIDHLKQRQLFQWSVAYLAGAWLALQLIDVVGAKWGMPDGLIRIIHILLVVGLFITIVLAWYHGEKGRQRISGPEMLIITGLLAVGGLGLSFLQDDVVDSDTTEDTAVTASVADERPWIAVLPFDVQSQDHMLIDFAAGMTEDITNGLSDFSYLLVLSRNATSKLAAESADIREIGQQLSARYVLQGSVRDSGSVTRISAQLVDAQNSTQIWSETFDRTLIENELLTVQDEITDRIIATVADPAGVVVRTLAAVSARKKAQEMTPYEAVLSYFHFQQRVDQETHLVSRTALENAVETEPDYTDAWTSLSLIYQQEFMNNLNPKPDSLKRALTAAQRAVDLDPSSARAHFAMAQASFFLRNIPVFKVHAQKSIELNPRNTDSLAMVGILMGYSGDWEQGVGIAANAMTLNPHHAGWYYFATFFDQYLQENYQQALNIAVKINMPDYWATQVALAISHAQLGNKESAEQAAAELLRIWPNVEQEYYHQGLINWSYNQPELIEKVNQGLQKSGIKLLTSDSN